MPPDTTLDSAAQPCPMELPAQASRRRSNAAQSPVSTFLNVKQMQQDLLNPIVVPRSLGPVRPILTLLRAVPTSALTRVKVVPFPLVSLLDSAASCPRKSVPVPVSLTHWRVAQPTACMTIVALLVSCQVVISTMGD